MGVQGFVFERCTPEPACQPPGTIKLHLQCNLSLDDCAVFPETRRTEFEAIGYTALFPTAFDSLLGYAYANSTGADPDGDGLPSAMEVAIGTNPAVADSDGDGVSDGAEFPFADVPVSDPCSEGPGNTCTIPQDAIFQSGFEPP